MDKKHPELLGAPFARCLMSEVSEGGQHVLSEVQASYASFSVPVQGGKSSSYGLGDQASGETEARLWGAKIPRA